MERVTGIGGVFIKARDPKKLAAWYQEHLGIPLAINYIQASNGTIPIMPPFRAIPVSRSLKRIPLIFNHQIRNS
jgi:hypothetical protein